MCTTYQVLKDFAGPAAAIIASGVAVFVTYRLGREQAHISREKLRLDLYERRWKIFKSIFDFYYVMIAWTGTDEQKPSATNFSWRVRRAHSYLTLPTASNSSLKTLNDNGRKVMSYKDGSLQGWDAKSKADLVKEAGEIQTFGFEEGAREVKRTQWPNTSVSKLCTIAPRRYQLHSVSRKLKGATESVSRLQRGFDQKQGECF